jgi:hypothetical protein
MENEKLSSKDLALTICFSSLYAIFCFFPIFQIVGLPNKSITIAAMLAPVIGMLLGPYLGALSTILGGIIAFFVGPLSLPGFVSGAVATFFAGSLSLGRRSLCAFVYFSVLFLFSVYPFVGPVWLFPPLMWFQILGFLILVSPLQSMALKEMYSESNWRSLSGFFVTSLTSTLAGQIAGSFVYELVSWPIFLADLDAWRMNWQLITLLYPIERVAIALGSTLIGVATCRILKFANLVQAINSAGQKKERS